MHRLPPLSALIALLSLLPLARAQATEPEAVSNCTAIIRSCQLPDGAIRFNASTDEVWIMPYFSNLAAMGLLAEGTPDDLLAVRRWLDWYRAHQEPDGMIWDYRGKIANATPPNGTTSTYAKTTQRDSTDSYAATYLMVLNRWSHATADRAAARQFLPSAAKAVDAIALTQNPDGLTWAKPDYRVKYLMDNLEVSCGLAEGRDFFAAMGEKDAAARCASMRDQVDKGLRGFWKPDKGCWAWALDADGRYSVGLVKWYPDGMANLLAISLVRPEGLTAWDNVKKAFADEKQLTPDWWLRAAERAGTKPEVKRLSAETAAMGADLTSRDGLDRLAWTILGLKWDQVRWPDVNLAEQSNN